MRVSPKAPSRVPVHRAHLKTRRKIPRVQWMRCASFPTLPLLLLLSFGPRRKTRQLLSAVGRHDCS